MTSSTWKRWGGAWLVAVAMAVGLTANPPVVEEGEPLPEAGYYHPRGDGFVNIRIADNRFEIYFLNADKVPQPVVHRQALVHYQQTSNRNNEGSVLLEVDAGGKRLVAPRPVRPPPLYFARVVFLEDGQSVELIARFDLR